MAVVVCDFPARAKPIHFSRKMFLQFFPRGLILCADGQLLGAPSLGQNRFLTTK
jgi:hypothetical protein